MSTDLACPRLFAVEVSSAEGEAVLVLHGELDLWTQPQFAAALARFEDGDDRLVLDLADLDFVDAGNVALIHRARKLARLRGADLVLRSPKRLVQRVLRLMNLDDAVADRQGVPLVTISSPSQDFVAAVQ